MIHLVFFLWLEKNTLFFCFVLFCFVFFVFVFVFLFFVLFCFFLLFFLFFVFFFFFFFIISCVLLSLMYVFFLGVEFRRLFMTLVFCISSTRVVEVTFYNYCNAQLQYR